MTVSKAQTILNPDPTYVKTLRRKIRDNNGFCPNQLGKTQDTKCPCKAFQHEGYCACGMHVPAADCVNHIH